MAQLSNVTFATDDPEGLASFWTAVLGGTRREVPEASGVALVEREDGPNLLFKDLPKGTERDLPIHLDLHVEDREEAIERFSDLGASVRETKSEEYGEHTHTWTVMEDPDGNGFCVTDV